MKKLAIALLAVAGVALAVPRECAGRLGGRGAGRRRRRSGSGLGLSRRILWPPLS
jgi:hypothetical protein